MNIAEYPPLDCDCMLQRVACNCRGKATEELISVVNDLLRELPGARHLSEKAERMKMRTRQALARMQAAEWNA